VIEAKSAIFTHIAHCHLPLCTSILLLQSPYNSMYYFSVYLVVPPILQVDDGGAQQWVGAHGAVVKQAHRQLGRTRKDAAQREAAVDAHLLALRVTVL
jgi:hypothetical protein